MAKSYENARKADVIKELKLTQKMKDFTGTKYPKGTEVWTGEKETKSATYHYTLDNIFDNDDNFTLVVERFSKTATVWSDFYQKLFPAKTMHTYRILN